MKQIKYYDRVYMFRVRKVNEKSNPPAMLGRIE